MTNDKTSRTVAMIADHISRCIERERAAEFECRGEGFDSMADAASERAYAYECARSFVLGILDSLTGTTASALTAYTH